MARGSVFVLTVFAAVLGLATLLGGAAVLLEPPRPRPARGDARPARSLAPPGGAAAPADAAAAAHAGGLEAEAAPPSGPDVGPSAAGRAVGAPGRGRAPAAAAPTGRVTVTRGGDPVPGARVRFYPDGLVGGRPLGEAWTGADGEATWPPGLDPDARYAVVAEADGRVASTRGLHDEDLWLTLEPAETVEGRVGGPAGAGVGARLTLRVGALAVSEAYADGEGRFAMEWTRDPEAVLEVVADGYVPLRRPAGQLDRVDLSELELARGASGDVAGRVVDGRGAPVPGALVRAVQGGRADAVAATDASGRFRLADLEAGLVSLEVHLADPVPAAVASARVPPGGTAEVEVALGGARLLVVVRDAGVLREGVRLEVVDPAITRYGASRFATSNVEQSATTRLNGTATFGLPAGRFFVRATHGRRTVVGEAVVPAQGEARLDLDLAEQRRLRVRVVDPAGEPVPGVFMDVSMPGLQWRDMPSRSTGADGVARFDELPAGLAELHLGKGGTWRMLRTDGEEAELVWTDETPLDVGGYVEGAEGEVLLAVVLPDVVKFVRAEIGGWDRVLEARLEAPAGERRVYLLAKDPGLAPVDLGAPGTDGAVRGFDVDVAPGGAVRGRLVTAEGGAGVAGLIELSGDLGGVYEARAQWLSGTDNDEWITVNEWRQATGPDGLFELRGLPAGTHALALRGLGCAPRTVTVTVEAGEEVDLGPVPVVPKE